MQPSADLRRHSRTIRGAVVLLGMLALSARLPAEEYRFLFLGPVRPVVLEVSFADTVIGIEQTRRRYAEGVLARLDTDRDGVLNPEEAQRVPADGRLRVGGPQIGVDWEDLDGSPADGQVSAEELFQFIDQKMGPRMSVEKYVKQSQTVRLYGDLDLNGDRRIDRSEVAEGLNRLRAFDFDDDETLSVAELQPFPLSVLQARSQEQMRQEPLPLVLLESEADRLEAARRILIQYGSRGEASGTGNQGSGANSESTIQDPSALSPQSSGNKGPVLSDPAVLNVRESIFRRFDTSKDGSWDAAELAKYLKLIPGEVSMTVMLTRRRVTVQGHRQGTSGSSSLVKLDLGGMTVVCKAKNRTYMQYDTVQLLKSYALQMDQDKNGYLDQSEFASFEGQARGQVQTEFTFAALDLDSNGQVTLDEISAYFTLDALFGQSRLVATLSDEALTLFDIIDGPDVGTRDRRLSLRDFRDGALRLLAFDVNGDGALSPGEIDAEVAITFGQPAILNELPNTANTPAARQPVVRPQLSGPLWFRRMDRNQDGDLTWGEFLGPRDDFERVDADQDGFITLEEAEGAESLRRDR